MNEKPKETVHDEGFKMLFLLFPKKGLTFHVNCLMLTRLGGKLNKLYQYIELKDHINTGSFLHCQIRTQFKAMLRNCVSEPALGPANTLPIYAFSLFGPVYYQQQGVWLPSRMFYRNS